MTDLDIRVRIPGLYLAKLQRVDCAFEKGQSTHSLKFARCIQRMALTKLLRYLAIGGLR